MAPTLLWIVLDLGVGTDRARPRAEAVSSPGLIQSLQTPKMVDLNAHTSTARRKPELATMTHAQLLWIVLDLGVGTDRARPRAEAVFSPGLIQSLQTPKMVDLNAHTSTARRKPELATMTRVPVTPYNAAIR